MGHSAAPDAPHASLVLTKAQTPVARDLVPRPALVERLASGPSRRLTLVLASAGWGKTTLLSAWASSPAERRPFAWVSLEAADGVPARFWAYVVEALQAVRPGLGRNVQPLLRAPGVDVAAAVLPQLLNELATLEGGAVLVLDDLHLVRSPALHEQLAFFVEHLPPDVEVAVATRSAPPLPLGRLRARGALLELGEPQLRFTASETDALLNRVFALDLPPDEVRVLHERTEGWAVGLYLAALSLRDHGDPRAFIDAFSGHDAHVIEYLSSEVLAALPEDRRDFLLCTSILDRLTGPACDAVAGTTGSTELLREIERTNLLLVALDDRRTAYRFHHLFGDLLRHQLDALHHGLASQLHRRAAAHFLEDGDEDRGIRHVIAAGDSERAVELVADRWSAALLERGDHAAIDGWLCALGEETVVRDPRLCVARAFSLHSLGRPGEATRWVEAAEARLPGSAPRRLRGDVAAARASNALHTGDCARALRAAGEALAAGDPASPWRPLPHGVLGHARRWSGDAAGALEGFAGWLEESERREQVLGAVCSHAEIALLEAEAGDSTAARAHARRALERAAGRFDEHWVTTSAHVALALVDGDRPGAARAVELARRGGPPGARANALVQAAVLLGGAQASRLIAEAAGLLAACPDPGALVVARLEEARAAAPAADPQPGEELSERELVVLRLLASDLSQREIGAELHVSLNTVKTHARHVFRKLGASGREDAVARARAAGVLP